jgi:hypothetical protein
MELGSRAEGGDADGNPAPMETERTPPPAEGAAAAKDGDAAPGERPVGVGGDARRDVYRVIPEFGRSHHGYALLLSLYILFVNGY